MQDKMLEINQKFLLEIGNEYKLKDLGPFELNFELYQVSPLKKKLFSFSGTDYLLINNDYYKPLDINSILDKIEVLEKGSKYGHSYLCIMPAENPTKESCTFLNNMTFVHFVLFDNKTKNLVYDKDFYYSGSKKMKQMIDTYQRCFYSILEQRN